MYRQPAFYFDATACSGCKTCMIACMDGNDLPTSVLWRRVAEFTGGEWTEQAKAVYSQNIFSYYMSVSCNHCRNPVCVQACPTTAMNKNNHGVVSVDHSKCVGCRYCELNCPYSAPQYNATLGKMSKCDFCYNRLLQGDTPLCVAAYPMRALKFGEYDELQKQYGGAAHIAPLPDPAIAEPCLVLTPTEKRQDRRLPRGQGKQPRGDVICCCSMNGLLFFLPSCRKRQLALCLLANA